MAWKSQKWLRFDRSQFKIRCININARVDHISDKISIAFVFFSLSRSTRHYIHSDKEKISTNCIQVYASRVCCALKVYQPAEKS